MCPVHGWDASCKCGYAAGLAVLALAFTGCTALSRVTPADRAAMYEADAKATALKCKAYRFDRAATLVPEVPAMARICAEE